MNIKFIALLSGLVSLSSFAMEADPHDGRPPSAFKIYRPKHEKGDASLQRSKFWELHNKKRSLERNNKSIDWEAVKAGKKKGRLIQLG